MSFNYNNYTNNNPLLKEYISDEEYDNMTPDEIDAAEKAGLLNPSDAPLGPENEAMSYPLIDLENAALAAKDKNIELEDALNIVRQAYGAGLASSLGFNK